jgi:alanine racemase
MATEGARAVLTIDLGALQDNYRRLRERAAGAETAGVVKADAYGLGADEVARALFEAGCRHFFVAQLDEGLALRRALPEATIYLLNGLPSAAVSETVRARLIPVLNHPGDLAAYAAYAGGCGQALPAALQLDTGMCRLGFSACEVERVEPTQLGALALVLVMSHLACAEERHHPMNRAQRARFEELRTKLPAVPASLANSSGIFLGPDFHYQLCRPGVALYGVNPIPGEPNPMAPVVTIEAPILQVHEVPEPGSVGYGATYATRADARIATVPVGYADGYLRAAGNRALARIGSRQVRVVGRVSMDLITLDVSDLPRDEARPGTMVELLGGPDGVDRFAEAAGTIGYEVLTRLGRRFARRYIRPEPQDEAA